MTRYLWSKLLFNASVNALGAILNQNLGELAADPETVDLMNQIVNEIFVVAHHTGVNLFWQTPKTYQDLLRTRILPSAANHRPSMLQDLLKGKKTEIDALNGYIVRLAHQQGLTVPINSFLTRIVKEKETHCQVAPRKIGYRRPSAGVVAHALTASPV
jgi:2-dehydropantoate 2-reductase